MEEGTRQSLLAGDTLALLEEVGAAELVVMVHARDPARNVGTVLEAVTSGLEKHFPARRGAVLVADAASGDGTAAAEQLSRASARTSAGVTLQLLGPAGSGRAIQGLLAGARHLRARACVLVDADLIGLTAEGIERLLAPILDRGAELVTPAYARDAAEGTLTTQLLAPLTAALYGKRLQQVAGGCLALAGAFLPRGLDGNRGYVDWSARGAEMWLTTEALASGARVEEVPLGRKVVDPGERHVDLATTLVRTVGPLFSLMERHREVWPEIRGVGAVPSSGETATRAGRTDVSRIERMVRAFRLGLKDLLPVWEQVMPEATLGRLYPLGLLAVEEFAFAPGLWSRVVADFAVAHHEGRLPRDHLVRALTPLYLGRVAAFLLDALARPARVPELLESIGRAFEAEKDDLVARWR